MATATKKATGYSLNDENRQFVERMAASMGMSKSAYVSLLIAEARRKQTALEEMHKDAMSSK